jgi:hypothetical protein
MLLQLAMHKKLFNSVNAEQVLSQCSSPNLRWVSRTLGLVLLAPMPSVCGILHNRGGQYHLGQLPFQDAHI